MPDQIRLYAEHMCLLRVGNRSGIAYRTCNSLGIISSNMNPLLSLTLPLNMSDRTNQITNNVAVKISDQSNTVDVFQQVIRRTLEHFLCRLTCAATVRWPPSVITISTNRGRFSLPQANNSESPENGH